MAAGAEMSRLERIRAVLAGREADRAPISFWCHFPQRDETVDGLVSATLEFARRFDPDLVKLMPTGMYPVLDYGATAVLREDAIGTTRLATSPIRSAGDWERLPVASPERGVLAEQVEVVRRVRAELGAEVPIIQTIFSPLTMAHKLAGGAFMEHVSQHEPEVRAALERFVEDVVAFGRACLDAGANGFFFATQHTSRRVELPPQVFERLGPPYDTRVLEALGWDERNWCTVLHLHGLEPRFDLAETYPVQAVNWHDRETEPSIGRALSLTTRALFAGINRTAAPTAGSTAMADEVRDAARQGRNRLLIAPGCVIPTNTPPATLLAMRQAVDGQR